MSRSTEGVEDKIVARSVDLSEIPVIDFSPFLHGGLADKADVAAQIAGACTRIGFFYLSGHGVDAALIDGAFAQSAEFYHRPLEEKQRALATVDWYRGWVPMPPAQKLSRNSRLHEQYRLQGEFDDGEVDPLFYRPNRWPEDMPAFRETCTRYYAAMTALSRELLKAFAIGLDLPEHRFDDDFRKPLSQLSLLYYIPLPDDADIEVSNTVSHTDEGPFTILAQDTRGGLEVKRRDGTWIEAPPIPGTLTINVGDMMMWWSNGRYLSNFHRVRNRSRHERFSIPFFMNPDRDVVVEPLPELVALDHEKRFEGVTVGKHLSRFYESLNKRAADEATHEAGRM
ncbi:MAG TPA: 2-oxoglutarate and iron-dependent oxygenase domain-containing protein [Paraburkholderia sp.]|nr:2-oxoglutarate and iron-dependent oxygenase domain-containing protein [Paraburkholderia sp.]